MREDLKNIKAGDMVIVRYQKKNVRHRNVEQVTATQIITELGTTWSRETGKKDGDKCGNYDIIPATRWVDGNPVS